MTEASQGETLVVRSVSHAFHLDGKPLAVLEDVSLDVKAGEFVSLLGPSGCGKSTLLRLVAGLDHAARGEILAGGNVVKAPDPSRILAFQDATLFPWATVWSNVATGLAARNELRGRQHVIHEALELVGLEKFASAYPYQLSGGMAQRAALARALVNDPKILLLDEPFGKLDALTRMGLQDELLAIWKRAGFTALMVTHDVEEALLLSNRIVVLSDRPARIVAEVEVKQDFPRRRDDPAIVALRGRILAALGHAPADGRAAA
ncbi:ABC transporter ATP-binding protein [Aestuariivirga sp.]|uniref:ABC transporter ATP-binding protein n=1 Tax=Aestuariivirga sp. TaxID=2650926 RepID=UPI0039E57154